MDTTNPRLEAAARAVQILGGTTQTARRILGDGSKYRAVQQWRLNGVPAQHAPAIEQATREQGSPVFCEELDPSVPWHLVRQQPGPMAGARALAASAA